MYLSALHECGSISAAAIEIGMSQPSLSESIAKLERSLGVQLAIRGTRGVRLTEAGLTLVRLGRDLITGADQIIGEVLNTSIEPSGAVSIAMPPSLGLLVSVPLAETVQSEFPLIRLHITEAMSGHIVDWMHADQIDLACVYEAQNGGVLSSKMLLSEELFVVSSRDNWHGAIEGGRALERLEIGEVFELPMVVPGRLHGARRIIERFAHANGCRLKVVTEIDSLPQIIEFVSRASAYSILPHAAVVREVDAGNLVIIPIAELTLRREAYIVRRRDRPPTRAALTVEKTLRAVIAELIDRYDLAAALHSESADEIAESKM